MNKILSDKQKFIAKCMRKFFPVILSGLEGMYMGISPVKASQLAKSLARYYNDTRAEDFEKQIIDTAHGDKASVEVITRVILKIIPDVSNEQTAWDKGVNELRRVLHLDNMQTDALEYMIVYYSEYNFQGWAIKLGVDSFSSFKEVYMEKVYADNFSDISGSTNDPFKKLQECGFLKDYGYYSPTTLFSYVVRALSNTDKGVLIRTLLGEPVQSNYKSKEFTWVKENTPTVKALLKGALKQQAKGVNILLYGAPGTGKTEYAKSLIAECKAQCYQVKSEEQDGSCTKKDKKMYDFKLKQLLLAESKNSCILFDEAEDVFSSWYLSSDGIGKNHVNKLLENNLIPTIWTTNSINVDPAFLRRMTYCVEFKELNNTQRKRIWKSELERQELLVPEDTLTNLVKTYTVPVSVISNAVKCTKLINGDDSQLKNFIESLGKVVLPNRYKKEQKKSSKLYYKDSYVNTDIDLPLLTSRLANAKNLNFSMCLYGEPGTGKSYYAKHLAKLLGVDVVHKRASDLIDSLVGNTEKNIAEAFKEANNAKAMLVFDEADSFLRSRELSKNSWEVTCVNEMLTQMENAKYPFICTTNLLGTLDEASLRRFTFKVKFDFMSEDETKEVLKKMFKIKEPQHIKGLTIGDCVTVQKKAKFLNITNPIELVGMLEEEVKVKQSANISRVGF